jgi:threonine dehydrogenase-like Zn-dependent dehydrogenase
MTVQPTKTSVLQIEAPGKPVWKTMDIPPLEPGEVLVKVRGITTCPHWDLHMMRGETMFPGTALEYPLVPGQPGHEAMGEIVAVSDGVTGFEPGMRVAAWRDPGNRRMGCYAEYVPIRAEDLLPVDPDLRPEEIASLELAMCVQGSFDQLLERGGVAGKRVAVSGLGPSGLIAVQLARAHGAKEVVGFDPLPDRRRSALDLGADDVRDPGTYAWMNDRFGAGVFDSALDTTGLPVSIERLMGMTRDTVAIFGVLRSPVRFGTEQWWGGFALLGYATHTRSAAVTAYRLIAEGKLRLAPLVTAQLPLERYGEGVEMLRTGKALKVLFTP